MNFINKSGIDLRLIENIYDFEIRYDPETSELEAFGSKPSLSEIEISDEVNELIKLQDQTIDNKWVQCNIINVKIEDDIYITVNLPNTGEITYNYNVPESWEKQYAIVQLCDRLGVNNAEQLINHTVAISPAKSYNINIKHTPFYDLDCKINSKRKTDNKIYKMIPEGYLEGNIPSSDFEKEHSSEVSESLSLILEVMLLIFVMFMLVGFMGSILDNVSEEIAELKVDVVVNEQNESISFKLEQTNNDSIIIWNNNKEIKMLDNEDITYKPENKGELKIVSKKESYNNETKVLSELDYNFTN